MRIEALRDAQRRVAGKVDHPGLRWDRFVPCQDDGQRDGRRSERDPIEERREFLQSFERVSTASLGRGYQTCFDAWRRLLEQRGIVRQWRAVYRVAFGAGDESVLEVGLRFHHTYGVPLIAGSALKGLVLRLARKANLGASTEALLGVGGDGGHAAAVTFHDALWVPQPEKGPFVIDTVTVHHPDYYRHLGPPTDWESPNPVASLSARGSFLFAIEGTTTTAALALRLLGAGLREEGIGAKTLKGYGRFDVPDDDALPRAVTGGPRPLFDDLQAGAAGAAAPARAVADHAAPTEESSNGALVVFQPNTGRFEVTVQRDGKPVKALTRPSPVDLFETTALMDATKARSRRRGFVRARVTLRIERGLAVVLKIEPDLPA